MNWMNLYRARGDKEMQAVNHRNVNTNTNDNTDNDVVEESDLEIISDDEFICKNFEAFSFGPSYGRSGSKFVWHWTGIVKRVR